ncbi:hypothetical protein CR203_09150 [Salipaludibacillus neizhouensis]|uniref:DUF4397 domain-containing protein n=1 Tax=Salipaludibacillus neizhouensis TaxID=885475 RepID=A0A3A9KS64_9BACI|nr:DUF4397 domain-containing protein [Salipaludibacillus neizhouensis]RKL67506.1 hypothetical protein CR203_09150 [Salipaludibacillus neizhouensis]
MKKSWLIVSFIAIVGLMMQFPNFTSADDTTTEQAKARVVHASPNATAVDVYLDDEKILTGMQFKELSEYHPLDEKSYEVKIYEEGSKPKNSEPVLEANITAMAGESYTLAVGGKVDELQLYEIKDDKEVNEEEAKLRVIHLSPDAPAIDVFSLDTPVVANVAFSEASKYENLAEGSYSLDIRPAGQEKEIFNIPNLQLEKGKNYSIIALGLLKGDPAFDVILAKDK